MGSSAHKQTSNAIDWLLLVIGFKLRLNVVDEFVDIRETQVHSRNPRVAQHRNCTRGYATQLASLARPPRQRQHRRRPLPYQMGCRQSSVESSVAWQRLLHTCHLGSTHLPDS